jgi:uncharacterized protein YgbK (DUF1537 family)
MQNIIKMALKTQKRILWVGTAAMADNLLSINYAMPPSKSIAQITALVLEKARISGLFLSGGDTSMGFFDIAKSLGSSIITEIAIGIPMMYLRGGKYDGLKIVTKAGAFGKEDAVFYALRKLKEID